MSIQISIFMYVSLFYLSYFVKSVVITQEKIFEKSPYPLDMLE